MIRAVATLASALLLGLSLPAGATAEGRPSPDQALARVASARATLAGGGLEAGVRAAADLGGVAVEVPSILEGSPGVDLLSAAVETASRLVEEAVPLDAEEGRISTRARRVGADGALREAGVDRAALIAASALLARAVDASLPALRALAARSDGRAACEQIDQPNVCVAGAGADTHTADKALLIDLGGNDVHANSAGGADRVGNGLPVSVTIDLAGNDRYETSLPTASGATVAQGSATGGIGILVDVEGDDVYRVTSTSPTGSARGIAFGGLGVGIVADRAGNDDYRLTYAPPAPSGDRRAQGLSFAGVGGTALLLDDLGGDSYSLGSAPTGSVNAQGQVVSGNALAQGLGYAEAGASLVYDGAGAQGGDRMTLEALSDKVHPSETREVVSAAATTEGMGFATLGGSAVVLTGAGATTYTARSIARAPTTGNVSVSGFGAASTGAFGALDDLGGDDVYQAEARTSARRQGAVDDACGCFGVSVETTSGSALTRVGGFGASATGLLSDSGGSDRYSAVSESTAAAIASDGRTELPPGDPGLGASAHATAAWATTTSLGYGALGGEGFVIDSAADDSYDLSAFSDATATANATLEDMRETSTAYSSPASVRGQAAGSTGGYGGLSDLGGSDRYAATGRSTATAIPETEEGTDVASTSVQGSAEAQSIQGLTDQLGGAAFLLEVDRGLSDVFSASPADPPCSGTRGSGLWSDCGTGAGGGFGA